VWILKHILEVFMHMADALLSPAVGGVMLAAGAAALGLSVKKVAGDKLNEKQIPMMGVMGAFVFAGQMINFTIPGTGSSGHIGGGILLAAILGPYPALITLASVLLIQCLFFADGGLLAYGCNVFNMGVTACLVAWPLIYRPLLRGGWTKGKTFGLTNGRITRASMLAVVAGLQLGAFLVVLETLFSGVTELPFGTFVLLMQPIHLAIGLVEGIVTAAVLCFVHSARPEILESALSPGAGAAPAYSTRKILVVFAVLAALVSGILSIFASGFPDGLEWSMERTAGTTELKREGPVFEAAAGAVEKTAFMPDYAFKDRDSAAGTAVAGIVGSVITVLLAGGLGLCIHAARRRQTAATAAGGGH
jgi:cobalt/nickel transport system permease protein